jgi:hypothetical protein
VITIIAAQNAATAAIVVIAQGGSLRHTGVRATPR